MSKEQVAIEVCIHLLRPFFPIPEEEKADLQKKAKQLTTLLTQLEKLSEEEGAKELNKLFPFSFLSDENAKEYIMNNPVVHQVASTGAEFLAYAGTIPNFDDKGMHQQLEAIFKTVNSENVTAEQGLDVLRKSLVIARFMVSTFKK